MAYTERRFCTRCGGSYMLVNDRGRCEPCRSADDLRRRYGEGDDADALMHLVEGHVTYTTLVEHERRRDEYTSRLKAAVDRMSAGLKVKPRADGGFPDIEVGEGIDWSFMELQCGRKRLDDGD